MVGFSLAHTGPLMELLASLALLGVWVLLALVWVLRTRFIGRPLRRRNLAVLLVSVVVVGLPFVPYGIWQRSTISLLGPGRFGAETLSYAAAVGDLGTVKSLLAKGLSVDTRNDNGGTPLMGAAVQGKNSVIKFLVGRGASVNLQDASGSTALMNAAEMHHPDTVRLLLKYGADPALRNHDGKTAADIAHDQRDEAVLRELPQS